MGAGALHKLKAAKVRAAGPGMISDGGNLWLRTSRTGAKSWIFRYTVDGKRRDIGLGSVQSVSLSQARIRAAEAREHLESGVDPLAARREQRQPQRAPDIVTFRDAMERYLRDHGPTWSSPKSLPQWRSSLEMYAGPLMRKPVGDITPADVADVLMPIWLVKCETASRLRQRIERIIGTTIARGERLGPNPATLRDNLDFILPPQKRVRTVKHHAAVPLDEAQEAFAALWDRRDAGMGNRALITVALTALRSGEVRHLERGDIADAEIHIPAARMKARRPHRIPVTPLLSEWLSFQPAFAGTSLVFPSQRLGPLSDMALAMAMRRAGLGHATPHGWRSVFRDWAAREGHASELSEDQLAHLVGSDVERAYRRHDFLDRRRPMMGAWEAWITAKLPSAS